MGVGGVPNPFRERDHEEWKSERPPTPIHGWKLKGRGSQRPGSLLASILGGRRDGAGADLEGLGKGLVIYCFVPQ